MMTNELQLAKYRLEQIAAADAWYEAHTAERGEHWERVGDLLDIIEFLQCALEQQLIARERWYQVAAALAVDVCPPAALAAAPEGEAGSG